VILLIIDLIELKKRKIQVKSVGLDKWDRFLHTMSYWVNHNQSDVLPNWHVLDEWIQSCYTFNDYNHKYKPIE